MNGFLRSTILTTGLAMFSMFFGAGNIVFPLALGQLSEDKNIFAIMGLIISAVAVPFTGLISMILFNGDYKEFFSRIGKWPGFLLSIVIMGLIGPFGAIPRCVTLSYSSIAMFLPENAIELPLFSALSCLIILFFTIKPSKILDVLGFFLTPFLLLSLGIIIAVGLFNAGPLAESSLEPSKVFALGFKEGYQTMDLLGAFFFSSVIILGLKSDYNPTTTEERKKLTSLAIKASMIGAFLLTVVYVGFSFLAAYMASSLEGVPKDRLLGTISLNVLGPYAGIVTSVAVALACLTTAIALANVFAHFLHVDILQHKLGYIPCLLITLLATYGISTLQFTGIVKFLAPPLAACYPALIGLSLLNIFYKLYDFKPVKLFVLIIFLATLLAEYGDLVL